ncbi:hypothetical protein N0V88_001136 [Collariella sp. IMI 366227]|nr:hypothetical protein N0V88_001136 [Collariella sp. IMI 366227]
MLHVNTESRAIALGHYRLGLAAPRGQPKVYFNPKRDIIGVPLDVMRTARARRLFRSTPDLRRVRRFCVAAPPPPDARGVRIVQRFLDGAEVWSVLTFSAHEVVVVDSAMVAYGVVPRIAGLDWEYWVRWMMIRGCARYVVVKEEGDKDDDGDEEEELDYDASGEDGGDDEIVEEEEEEEEDWSD